MTTETATSTRDPFNWPSYNRKDLMSATGGLRADFDLQPMKTANLRPKTRDTSQNLDVTDICGAQPRKWVKVEVNKPEYGLNNFDIEGSGPRLLHCGLNKQYFNLTNSDIEGSAPCQNKFKTKRQPSNPLNPVYKLQSFTYVPPEPPKFIRDAMTNQDIDGSRAIKKREVDPRDVMRTGDIEGAKATGPR